MNQPEPTSSRRRRHRPSRRARSHHAAAGDAHHAVAIPDHPLIPQGDAQWIDTAADLAEFIAHVRQLGRFAYDTEFIGELSYYPKLCLIQMGTTERVAVIDAQAGIDLTPVWELIADSTVQVVVHAGMQDLEPVVRHLNRPPANVIDTQVAAGFAALPYPVALSKVVDELLGVRLGKGLTFTSWDERPLSAAHRRYAADDVRYLPALAAAIEERLAHRGHADWAQQECATLCDASLYVFDPSVQMARVRGGKTLTAKQRAILREMVVVRDTGARKHDLPPRSFLRDEVMVELARHPVRDLEKLAQVRGMPRPVAAEYGRALIEAMQRGAALDRSDWPAEIENNESPGERFRIDALWIAVQSFCMARGIDPTLVTNRQELADAFRALTAGGEPNGKLKHGWRRIIVESFIAPFLRGERALDLHWRDAALRCDKPMND
ncbi:MAG: hypothetical protein GC162_08860 [Planctomycetes bacterium]|nr:hypothetical protein [Planctomycetota bacterium]